MDGEIVLGALAPHPPHLVYAENPPQNEPNAECGWEGLRWGYHRLAKKLSTIDYDAIVIFSPHWQTYIVLISSVYLILNPSQLTPYFPTCSDILTQLT